MTKTFMRIASAIAAIAGTVGAAQAQTVAPGPYYATPSWDQTLACTAAASCPRFVVLSNMNSKAVLDRETGLVWLRETFDVGGGAGTNFDQAQRNCFGAHWGTGRMGWRLPTAAELTSLLATVGTNTSLPAGHPFVLPAAQSQAYWSTTDDLLQPGSGRMTVVFMPLGTLFPANKAEVHGVWCVRGG